MVCFKSEYILASIVAAMSTLLLLQSAAASDDNTQTGSCSICDCLVNSMDTIGTLIDRKIEARLSILFPDECAQGTDNCNENADCINTKTSFTCQCRDGFEGNGETCTDVNECNGEGDGNNCDVNADCTNTVGSFTCQCRSGYEGNGVTCTDVDECAEGTDNCDENADCTNTDGSFTCTCRPGYQEDRGTSCDDVDECETGAADCVSEANCVNTVGSFTCTCPPGRSDTSGREGEGCFAISGVPACGEGDWFTVISLDLTDSQQSCPDEWSERTSPIRSCETAFGSAGCVTGFLETINRPFTRIAGRARGFQVGSTDSFSEVNVDIDDVYVDGLSVTFSPSISPSTRNHIWTFAAGLSETMGFATHTLCPCLTNAGFPQAFVGNNYFCESGNPRNTIPPNAEFLGPDPLWDGALCEGGCCSGSFSSVPWFCVTMENQVESGAVIEVRNCKDQSQGENIAIDRLEIYIQ